MNDLIDARVKRRRGTPFRGPLRRRDERGVHRHTQKRSHDGGSKSRQGVRDEVDSRQSTVDGPRRRKKVHACHLSAVKSRESRVEGSESRANR